MSVNIAFRGFSCLLLASAVGVAVAQSGEFRRTLTVGGQPDIYISTGSGNIHVTPSDSSTVTIVGHIHSGWPHHDGVEARIRRIVADPPIRQSGNQVHVGDPPDRALLNNISIDYEVQAPRSAALNLRTGSGDTEVDGVGRFLAAQSGSGTLKARGIQGPAELHTGSGDIELEQTGQGGVHARTGSGSLRLTGLRGPLEAHTGSGDLDAAGRIEGPGEISTGSGSVHIRFSPGDRVAIDASTGSGTVHASIPGLNATAVDNHSLRAQINGGGEMLKLHTGSGDIDLSQE